jgi:putative DNA methylase
LYGLTTFGDLFTGRQLETLTTFSDLVQEVRDKIFSDVNIAGLHKEEASFYEGGVSAYADAIVTYLAFAVDKMTTTNTSTCAWQTKMTRIVAAFSRQGIPMVWDYAEAKRLYNSLCKWSEPELLRA